MSESYLHMNGEGPHSALQPVAVFCWAETMTQRGHGCLGAQCLNGSASSMQVRAVAFHDGPPKVTGLAKCMPEHPPVVLATHVKQQHVFLLYLPICSIVTLEHGKQLVYHLADLDAAKQPTIWMPCMAIMKNGACKAESQACCK